MAYRLCFNKEIRSRVFTKRNIFGEHVINIRSKFYVGLVFALNTGFFIALVTFAFSKQSLLSIPYYLSFNPWLVFVPMFYIIIGLLFAKLRSNAINAADSRRTILLNQIQLALQAATIIGGLLITLGLPATATIHFPEWTRWMLKGILFMILAETYKLSFYAMHYALKAYLSFIHYKKQNIYSVAVRSQLPAALERIFTDNTPGWYSHIERTAEGVKGGQPVRLTLGQERISGFEDSVLRELSDVLDYQFLILPREAEEWKILLSKIREQKMMICRK